jgi:hypothetical protein
MFIWLVLASAATTNLGLFNLSIIHFFKQRQMLILQPQQTPQTFFPPKSSIHQLQTVQITYHNKSTTTTGFPILKTISEHQSKPISPMLKIQKHRDYF